MFIIWGTKTGQSHAGYAAHYCPFCRAATQMSVAWRYAYFHVYFLRLGGRRCAGHTAACTCCQMETPVDVSRYTSLARRRFASLEDCIQKTNPACLGLQAERAAQDERVRQGQASEQERHNRIKEPFWAIDPMLRQRYASMTPIDRRTTGVFLACLLIGLALIMAGGVLDASQPAALGALVIWLGFPLSLVTLATTHRRYLRKRVYPALARNLAPLRPTEQEVAAILQTMKNARTMAGRKLKARRLLAAIEERRCESMARSVAHS